MWKKISEMDLWICSAGWHIKGETKWPSFCIRYLEMHFLENLGISIKSLFPGVKFAIFQHWFRQWLGADQATCHYLNQRWLVYWRIYASFGLNEFIYGSNGPTVPILKSSWRLYCRWYPRSWFENINQPWNHIEQHVNCDWSSRTTNNSAVNTI